MLAVLTFDSMKVIRTVRFYNQSSYEPWISWSTTQTGYIRTIAISRDNILASGNDDSTILLYHVDEKKAVNELLRGHTNVRISYVQDSPCRYSDA
jgi:WD40 repeat protein